MRPLYLIVIVALFGSAVFNASANAANEAETNAIIKSLAPIAGQTVTPGYKPAKPSRVVIRGRTIYLDRTYTVDLEVYFAFDSSRLTRRARRQLDALGRALESRRLLPYSYLIAGHTDATGRASYNQILSERRAAAVMRFLVERYAIDPVRLASVGFGERYLKDPDYPLAAINRRVEVILIVPPGGASSLPPAVPAPAVTPPRPSTTIVVPPSDDTVTITIEKDDSSSAEGASKQPAASASGILKEEPPQTPQPQVAGELPPCPDPSKTDLLDDIRPRPGIDCQKPKPRPGSIE